MGRISKSIFFIGVIFTLSPVREPLPFMGANSSSLPSRTQTARDLDQVRQQLLRQQSGSQSSSDVIGITQSLSSLLNMLPQGLWGAPQEHTQPVVKTVPRKPSEKEPKHTP